MTLSQSNAKVLLLFMLQHRITLICIFECGFMFFYWGEQATMKL